MLGDDLLTARESVASTHGNALPLRVRTLAFLDAVALQCAVLCADCDVVSDSPHDICMICGSRSLINICRILGGKMSKNRVEPLGGATAENQPGSCAAFPETSSSRSPVVG